MPEFPTGNGKIDDTNRQTPETPYTDNERKICVKPVLIETGE